MTIGTIPAIGTIADLGLERYDSSAIVRLSDAAYDDKAVLLAFVEYDNGWDWLAELKALRNHPAFPSAADIVAVVFKYGGTVQKLAVLTKLDDETFPFRILVDGDWTNPLQSTAREYTKCFQASFDAAYGGADESCAGNVFWACILQRDHRVCDKWRYGSSSATAPSEGDPLAFARLPAHAAIVSLGGASGAGEYGLDLSGMSSGGLPLAGDSRLTWRGAANAFDPGFPNPRVKSAVPADGSSPADPSPVVVGFTDPMVGADGSTGYAVYGPGAGSLSVDAVDYRDEAAFDSKLQANAGFYILQRLAAVVNEPCVLYAEPERRSPIKTLPSLRLVFSRPMNPSTVHGATANFTPSAAGVTVQSVSYEGRGLIENVATISLNGNPPPGDFSITLSGVRDISGNALAGELAIRYTIPEATVVDVSSPDANDVYGIGDDITVLVAFSEPVTVVGSPRLELELNTSGPVYAAYDSGSGGDTLSFLYSVAEGHQSADLDYKSSASLSPNGGSIKDAAGNDAALTLPAPGTVHSLGHNKAIVIDGSAETPEAATVVAVGSSKADGSYKAGVAIPIAVEFSAPVTVTGSPTLALNAGPGAAAAIVAGQAFPRSSVEFRYVVAAGHQSADLDYSSAGALALNGGSIKGDGDVDAVLTLPAPGTAGSLGHGRAIVVDTTRPVIVAVCYEKSVLATGRVKLLLKLTFSERVFVMTGWLPGLRAGTVLSPRGAPDVRFGYLRGSGGWTLEFGSTLPAGTTWPTAPAPAGLRITLEVVSGYVRDEAKNDAALRFQADLACSCPETPHCVKPIVCKLPEGCLAPVACKLPEYCKTPVFCKLPEACQFPEGCVLPEACKAPVSCKIPEYCKFPLTDGCGLPVNCPGLVGACKGMVDPIPFDPSQTGYPPELDELLRRADGLASEGGGAALDAFMASGDYAERLGRLDPASRRAVAAQLDAIRKELG